MDKKRMIIKTVMFVCVAIMLAISFKAGEGGTDTSEPVPPPKATAEDIRAERGEELLAAPPQKSEASEEESSADNPSDEVAPSGAASDTSEKNGKTGIGNTSDTKKSDASDKASDADSTGDSKASENICSISVNCGAALKNSALAPEKAALLPSDGIVYASESAVFKDGETVFDVLKRELTQSKIHLEFSGTPGYGSMYVEGINNLYEYDCGELSGWTYKVNGEFPKVGCSKYVLKQGDKIEWIYTCDFNGEF